MPQSLMPITLPADPTAPLEAATKQYVDNKTVSVPEEVVVGAVQPTDPATDFWVDTASTAVAATYAIWTGTQTQYNAIPVKNAQTLYVVV